MQNKVHHNSLPLCVCRTVRWGSSQHTQDHLAAVKESRFVVGIGEKGNR